MFTGRVSDKGLKGPAAVKAVEERFDRSKISNLKLKESRFTAKEYAQKLRVKKV